MTFKLEINCDNAAFDEDELNEVGRILKHLATRLDENYEREGNLWDYCGNRVGHFQFKGKRPE